MYMVLLRRSETTSQPCLRHFSIKLPNDPTSELVGPARPGCLDAMNLPWEPSRYDAAVDTDHRLAYSHRVNKTCRCPCESALKLLTTATPALELKQPLSL